MQTHAFGLNNSYTFRTKWLQTYAQHGVSYRRTTSSAATTSPEEKGWAYNASLRNTFFFNEKKTLLATLSGSYSSRQYQGIYLMSPTYSVSAGMLYRLLNNQPQPECQQFVCQPFQIGNHVQRVEDNCRQSVCLCQFPYRCILYFRW